MTPAQLVDRQLNPRNARRHVMGNPNRFASFDEDGSLSSLVAEGPPEFPADNDLSAFTDEQVGELHDALLASIPALSEDPDFDPADATTLAEHITALRD